jgi:hypothetical protein
MTALRRFFSGVSIGTRVFGSGRRYHAVEAVGFETENGESPVGAPLTS